jgi:outer membrane usher protein
VLPAAALALSLGAPARASDLATPELTTVEEAEAVAAQGDAITPRTNETLQLEVVINDRSIGMIGEFVIRGGRLFARRDELASLGLTVPASAQADGDLIPLEGVAGFAARIDQASQMIYITAGNDWLMPTELGYRTPPADYVVEGNPGATLNYDLIAKSVDGRLLANGALDFRAFSRLGVFSTGTLFYANSDSDALHRDGGFKATRLETSYVYSDPDSMRRYRAGDLITGGLPWTRPVRLGGAQVDRDFSMRPDLITFPVPQVLGSASVPSTVDVLVNNRPVASGPVPVGPFSMPDVPVVSGSGTVTTTVTDALGRQVVTQTPFYTTSALLSPGLQTYSGEIGVVRRNYGILSADYRDIAGSGTYSRGLSRYLTIEAHAEATSGLAMAGIGGVANLFDFAVASVAVAGSTHSGHSGGQVSAGIERISEVLSFGASIISADSHFADIAAINGDPVTRLQFNVHGGISLAKFGSLGLAYVETKQVRTDFVGPQAPVPPSKLERRQLMTASYSRQFGRLSFYATAFRAMVGEKNTTVMFGVAIPLAERTTATVGAQTSADVRSAQFDVGRTAIVPGDWGFHAFASVNGQPTRNAPWIGDIADHEFGQVTYKNQWGQVYAGVDRTAGKTTVQGEVVGAVSFIDNALFASNRIDDSFAVVDTGLAGMHVLYENRDVGRTDASGRMVVPDLLSFQLNQIAINPLDAPVDADVALTTRSVRPLDRTGVVVRLPVKVAHGAILRIVDETGVALPVGSTATLKSTNVAAPVGYDGDAYLVDLLEHNDVTVELPDGKRCAAAFDYLGKPGDIPTIGPVPCREMAR